MFTLKNIQKNSRSIFLGSLTAMLCVLGVASAVFNSELNITGSSNISTKWDIRITDIKSKDIVGNAEDDKENPASYSELSASFNALLHTPGDSITYDITITNSGSLDATLNEINKSVETNSDKIKVEFSGFTQGQILYRNKPEVVSVKITYIQSDVALGENTYPTLLTNKQKLEPTLMDSEEVKEEAKIKLSFLFTQEKIQSENGLPSTNEEDATKYLVSYDCTTNGSKECRDNNEYVYKGESADLNKQGNKKENYIFMGWNTDKDATGVLSELTINKATTLYAIYAKDEVAINSINTTSTTNKVTVISKATAPVEITKYEYSLDGETYTEGTIENNEGKYTFNNLQHNKTYTIYVKATSFTGKEKVSTKEIKTEKIDKATLSQKQNNTTKILTITYPEGCGNAYTCTYQKDSGSITVVNEKTVQVSFTESGKIKATVSDGYNDINTEEDITVENITPTISIEKQMMDGIIVKAETNGSSEIDKYEFSIDGGTTWIDNGTNDTYTFTDLNLNEEYSIQTRITTKDGAVFETPSTETSTKEPSFKTTVTTNSIIVEVDAGAVNGIKEYSYSIDGGETWTTTTGNTYTYTGLDQDKEYEIVVKVITNDDKEASSNSKGTKTEKLEIPNLELDQTSEGRDGNVTFPEECGSTYTCTYQKNDGEIITVNEGGEVEIPFDETGTLKITINDGINEVTEEKTIVVENITPTITIEKEMIDGITVKANTGDNEDIVKYEFSIDGGETWVNSGDKNDTYTFKDLTLNEEYNIIVRITTEAGNVFTSEETKSETKEPSFKTTVTSNSIIVEVETDAVNGIKTYEYSIDGGETWIETTGNTYTFTGLDQNENYEVLVRVTTNDENTTVSPSEEIKTEKLEIPNLDYEQKTDSKDTTINFPEECASTYTCTYQKNDGEIITVNEGGEVEIPFDETGTLKITINDGTNEVTEEKTITVETNITPTITIEKSYIDGITVKANAEAPSGIAKYEFSIDGGTTWKDNGNNDIYTFNDLDLNEDYNILTRITTNGGNVFTSESASASTSDVTISTTTTPNSITVVVNAESTSEIEEYEYSKDGGQNWVTSSENTYTFTELNSDDTYQIMVKVKTDNKELSIDPVDTTPVKLSTPTYNQTNTNGTATITITYPNVTINGSSVNICTQDGYTCQYSTDNSQTWTPVTTNTKDVSFSSNGTNYLTARIQDNTNDSNTVTASTRTIVISDATREYTCSSGTNGNDGYCYGSTGYTYNNSCYTTSTSANYSSGYYYCSGVSSPYTTSGSTCYYGSGTTGSSCSGYSYGGNCYANKTSASCSGYEYGGTCYSNKSNASYSTVWYISQGYGSTYSSQSACNSWVGSSYNSKGDCYWDNCTCTSKQDYYCSSGTLGGSYCYSGSGNYTCSSGTLGGTYCYSGTGSYTSTCSGYKINGTCYANSKSAAYSSGYYYCSSGTLGGSYCYSGSGYDYNGTCYQSARTTATTNYTCTSGEVSGNKCIA